MLAQEASGWILVPIGVTRRYYDEKGRCFRNQFVPIAYAFTKSETSIRTLSCSTEGKNTLPSAR